MRLITIIILSVLSLHASAQVAQIDGKRNPYQGATEYYAVNFPYGVQTFSVVNWYVSGGVILSSGPAECWVLWDDDVSAGYLSVEEDINSQWGGIGILIGSPTISPISQLVAFAQAPQQLCIEIPMLDIPVGFQWQQSSNSINWTNISSETSQCYQPPGPTGLTYYRCVVTVEGNTYGPIAVMDVQHFEAGEITLVSTPSFNGAVNIANTPAIGGQCASPNYQYVWEASVEGGDWTQIGTGVNFPSYNAVGNTRIRRKVTACGNATKYTNVLLVTPSYTPVDYENRNYIRIIDVQQPGIKSWYQADALTIDNKTQSTTYLDGLGRAIQDVDKKESSSGSAWNDMVQHYEYDANGRTIKSFLPYSTAANSGKFKTTAAADQASFIQTKFNEPGTAPTYSLTEYDNSPLNRVTKVFNPGQSWGGSNIYVGSNYSFNDANENVHIWNIDPVTKAPVTTSSMVYGAGVLFKHETVNEKGKKEITYTDFGGKIILRKQQKENAGSGLTIEHAGWICTYYVYDDLDRLRYTIPAKAVDYLDAQSWSMPQNVLNELCFKYEYDEKGRSIVKKQPGVGEQQLVYDNRGRLVLSQDGNQNAKTTKEWMFYVYDDENRMVAQGYFSNNASRSAMQTFVDASATGKVDVLVSAQSVTYTLSAYNPITKSNVNAFSNCNSCTSPVFTLMNFYDNVTGNQRTFSSNYTFAYTTSQHFIEATASTQLVKGLLLEQVVRSVPGSSYYHTTFYYDHQGRVLQTLSDNVKSGVDIYTAQYDFRGRTWSTSVSHMSGTANQFSVTAKNELDKLGRMTALSKNYNNTFYKQLATYAYDEMGQLTTKRLAPGYTGSGKNEMESLSFDYNILGLLNGINKSFALGTSNSTQWDNFFGMYLGYDNADGRFASPQYNGSVAGTMWRSQGDNAVRKYDYTYDNANRLNNAQFNQKAKPSDGWSNAEVDFSSYAVYADGNGNLQSLKQIGIVPGISNGIIVDELQYTYTDIQGTSITGNLLKRVNDLAVSPGQLGANNGKLSDFTDGSNPATADDYLYDANGNLTQDLNKGISGATAVIYNFLDKPEKVTIPGKTMIEYTYNGLGEKLSKKVTDLVTSVTQTTYYIDGFIYADNNLSFILHEEGRLKIITPVNTPQLELNAGSAGVTLANGNQGVFEYFVKDNLGSTRIVLTDEYQKEKYLASMETSSTSNPNLGTDEEKLFGKVDNNGNPVANENELQVTRDDKPAFWNSTISNLQSKVAKLTASSSSPQKRVGPNLILKVMAGDIINSNVPYYYYNNNNSGPTVSGMQDMVLSLVGALLGNKATELTKVNSSLVNSSLTSSSPLSTFINSRNSLGNTSAPKAFLNIVFFDEQFKFVDKDLVDPTIGSDVARVSLADNQGAALTLQKKAPKNGWVFIYVSNESNEDVYFDNLAVTHEHSRIAEETHYYPHGLKIAGISSAAFNKLKNNYAFQGDYNANEDELGWNDFELRSYDAQIGRFLQADPYTQFMSPYTGMGNNPVNIVDPSGGIGIDFGELGRITGSVLGDRLLVAAAGALIGWGIDKLTGGDGGQGAAIGAAVGFGVTFIPPFDLGAIGKGLKRAAPDVAKEVVKSVVTESAQSSENTREVNPAGLRRVVVAESPDVDPPGPGDAPNLRLPDPLAPWVQVADGQLNVRERTGNNDGPEVERYLRTVGLGSGYAWCAAFINWTLRQVNLRGTGSGGSLTYLRYGQRLARPAYGSIAVIDHGNGFGHVGFVAGETADGRIVLLGGNQNDMVNYSAFARSGIARYVYPAGLVPVYQLPVLNVTTANARTR